jgi:deoxyribonuclease-4
MIGSHCSIAGGLERAIAEARALELDCVQVFTRNQRQWKAPPLSAEQIAAWRKAVCDAGWDDRPARATSHNSYLVNLASPDPEARAKSIALQRDELERCAALGIAYCVAHPGAHLGASRPPKAPNLLRQPWTADEDAGLDRIAASLDQLHKELRGVRTITCLETTTGSGTNLGYDFAHLAAIRTRVREPERVGFCLDTCHVASAGYDVSTEAKGRAILDEFDSVCGLDRLFVVHVNDSKAAPGSRADLHEHIGLGTCGEGWFRAIMLHPKLAETPKILETAKENDEHGRPWDARNAARLRAILSAPSRPADRSSRARTTEKSTPDSAERRSRSTRRAPRKEP